VGIAQGLLNGGRENVQQPFQIVGDTLGNGQARRDGRGQQRARSKLGVF
jgi:hypothetical protein